MSDATSPSDQPSSAGEFAQRVLKVGGVTPFTATDFPGELAAVIFVQGCPWRCGYCHNTHLQPRTSDGLIPWNDVLELLHRRVELIDAVVFSGGEPAIDPAIVDAIWVVRKMGFKIGLHSAGIYPERLTEVLPWLDWIGLDIKAPFGSYEKITGVADSGAAALASAQAVLASDVKHEFRTTVHASLLEEDEIASLAENLAEMGVQNYALQVFRNQGCKTSHLNTKMPADYPSPALQRHLNKLFPSFSLRRA